MEDVDVGRVVRRLRRRLGRRQQDVASQAGCSQSTVSLIERGHLDLVSLRVLRRILAALDASAVITVRWRAGALDRLLDEDHALLVGHLADFLQRAGWDVETEVTYSVYGERGSYDLLAWQPRFGALLVVEVKTDLVSAEATLRKLDEKVRLAPAIARERHGWRTANASRLLAMPDDRTLRRRVARHAALFEIALPERSVAARRWVRAPVGPLSAIWFLTSANGSGAIQSRGGRERVRVPRDATSKALVAV